VIGTPFLYFQIITTVNQNSAQKTSENVKPSPTSGTANESNPYVPSESNLALQDPLINNSGTAQWDDIGRCVFTSGSYHIFKPNAPLVTCTANNTNFSDFTFQVSMTILQGGCGGMLFRNDGPSDDWDYYLFEICQDGRYGLMLDDAQSLIPLQDKNPAINVGLNQPNVIAVVASGKNMDLYVNQQKINSFQDGTRTKGRIGVFVDPRGTVPTEVAFSNVKIWT